jgi:hypothetical protein
MEYEIELNFDKALKDPKAIDAKIKEINKIIVDMASNYYIEKSKDGHNKN